MISVVTRALGFRSMESNRKPNKPDAANPAMTLQFHARTRCRRVADLER